MWTTFTVTLVGLYYVFVAAIAKNYNDAFKCVNGTNKINLPLAHCYGKVRTKEVFIYRVLHWYVIVPYLIVF